MSSPGMIFSKWTQAIFRYIITLQLPCYSLKRILVVMIICRC